MGQTLLCRSIALVVVVFWVACDRAQAQTSYPSLHPRISGWIQIDQAGNPPTLGASDANLFSGADPGDASASFDKPLGGASPYIDWDDLGGNLSDHRLLDLNDAAGHDTTAFPQSNECRGVAGVLSKLDFTYVAIATNEQYAHIATQRSDNSGDAGCYWLFTRLPPDLIQGQSPCSPTQQKLMFSISTGDILVATHFANNGTPLAQVFVANSSTANVNAISAIDFTNTRWTTNANGIAAAALNTTITAPGSFGSAGVKQLMFGNLATSIFSEIAI